MAQITLYLDDDTAERMRAAAEAAGVSLSRWVAELIRRKVTTEWPTGVVELAGAWPDLPLASELRDLSQADARREEL